MRLRFVDCLFDRETRQLRRGGRVVSLSPKAFRMLETLLAQRPRAVSKQELCEAIWPSTFVAESNLSSLAAEIRRAIGQKGRSSSPLRTVHGHGYAFAGDAVEETGPADERELCRVTWGRRRWRLKSGAYAIGRDAASALFVDDDTVSRRHAQLIVGEGEEAWLEDLGSKNGTFVRGRRVSGRTRLRDGDEFRIGSVTLSYRTRASMETTTTVAVR